jgi:flagellar assembly protein FliH
LTNVIPSADIDHEPVILTYRRVEPAPVPSLPLKEAVQHPQPPAAPPPPLAQVEDPEATLDGLRKWAFEEGYREGAATGAAEVRAELVAELAAERAALGKARGEIEREHEALEKLIGSVHEALERGIEGTEDVIVEIAFAAACKVLGEAAVTDEGVRGMVREATREIRGREKVVVRISGADHERLAMDPARLKRLGDELKVELAADERVALGGCLIETAGGTLDARLEVQLRQLLDTLVKVRAAGDTLA